MILKTDTQRQYKVIVDVKDMTLWQFQGTALIMLQKLVCSSQGTSCPMVRVKLADVKKAVVVTTRSVSTNRTHWQTLARVSCWYWWSAKMTTHCTNDALHPPCFPSSGLEIVIHLLFQSHQNILTYLDLCSVLREILPGNWEKLYFKS